MILVSISLAVICFGDPLIDRTCKNALIGKDTPRGTFQLEHKLTNDPFYGGDVLQFKEDENGVWAVHRVWLGRPEEHRERRIKSDDVRQRLVTMGCINVEPEVYEAIVNCCSHDTIVIE